MQIIQALKTYRYLVLIIIVPIFLNIYLLLYKETKSLEKDFENRNLAITYEFKNSIENYLGRKVKLADFLLSLDELKSGSFNVVRPILQKAVQSNPGIRGIFLYNREGFLVSYTTNLDTAPEFVDLPPEDLINFNVYHRLYFQEALKGKKYISDLTINGLTNTYFITIALPWYDLANQVQGVMALSLSLEYLNELHQAGYDERTYKALIDGNGLPLIHPENSIAYTASLNGIDTVASIQSSPLDNQKKLFTYLPINGTQWYALVIQPYTEIQNAILKNFFTSSLAILMILLITVCLFYLFIKEQHEKKMLELIRQERLNNLTEIAASVAHEIRNPLVAVKGFVQLEQMKAHSTMGQSIPIVLSEIKNIETIITEFLTLSKNIVIKFTDLNITKRIRDISVLMTSQANMHNINFHTNIPPEDLTIEGDPMLIQQLMVNLIKNAFEAVGDGGYVSVAVVHNTDWIHIIISDNGPGMPEGVLAKLGTPFNSQKENGTGLGLAICKRIIDTHHGTWEIRTGQRLGTSVKVLLPVRQPKQL